MCRARLVGDSAGQRQGATHPLSNPQDPAPCGATLHRAGVLFRPWPSRRVCTDRGHDLCPSEGHLPVPSTASSGGVQGWLQLRLHQRGHGTGVHAHTHGCMGVAVLGRVGGPTLMLCHLTLCLLAAQTSIKHTNDAKRGGFEIFKFDKVFGQSASQDEVGMRMGGGGRGQGRE